MGINYIFIEILEVDAFTQLEIKRKINRQLIESQ